MARILTFGKEAQTAFHTDPNQLAIPCEDTEFELVDLNKFDYFQIVNSQHFDLQVHRETTAADILQVQPSVSNWVVVHSFSGAILERCATKLAATDFAHRLTMSWLDSVRSDKGLGVRFEEKCMKKWPTS